MAKKPAARSVKSLLTLLAQINAAAPKRSKASDGWIGDPAHAARKSDHNPEADGTVDARDFTHDPKNGVDIQKIADAIIASRDPRVANMIVNGKIISGNAGPSPWVKRAYKGPNKHTKHIHIGVLDGKQDDTTPWEIDAAFGGKVSPSPTPPKKPAPKPAPAAPKAPVPSGANKETIERVQEQLIALGYTEVGGVDGKVGTMTRAAIRAFRAENGLPPSDQIDDVLLLALQKAKPREMNPDRSGASEATVREKVPEVHANWLAKMGAFVVGIPAAIGGLFDGVLGNLGPAAGYIQPIKDYADDVPGWVWLAGLAAIAGGLYLIARRGERKGVEAFKTGARR